GGGRHSTTKGAIVTKTDHHVIRCLIHAATSLGFTLPPGHDMSWPFTASRHPDLLTEAIDAGAAHAAACFTHALFTLAGELLREDTTTTNDADPQWAAEQATRQAAADHHRRAARRRL